MLAATDEGKDLGNRAIRAGQGLHRAQPLGEHARSVKQLLIKLSNRGKPLARELAALHADDIEAFEAGVLAIDETKRNHVAANPTDAADHHLWPDPGELVHRGQATDEHKIADLTVTAERGGGREDDIVADLAIVPHMAAIHEITAVADAGDAATGHGPGVHGHRF